MTFSQLLDSIDAAAADAANARRLAAARRFSLLANRILPAAHLADAALAAKTLRELNF